MADELPDPDGGSEATPEPKAEAKPKPARRKAAPVQIPPELRELVKVSAGTTLALPMLIWWKRTGDPSKLPTQEELEHLGNAGVGYIEARAHLLEKFLPEIMLLMAVHHVYGPRFMGLDPEELAAAMAEARKAKEKAGGGGGST